MFKKILISILVLVVISIVYFSAKKGDGPDEYAGHFFLTSGLAAFVYFFIIMFYKILFPFSDDNLAPTGSADGILAIFMDKNDKDVHLFSYNSTSRVKTGQSRLRLVQHYFIEGDTGKSYYHPLFSFSSRAAKGRAGYEEYESFEKDVIPTVDFDESMDKFSKDLGKNLMLGYKFSCENEDDYRLGERRRFRIQTVEKEFGRELTAVYIDLNTRETLWTARI